MTTDETQEGAAEETQGKEGRFMSMKLTPKAHEKLKTLRRDLVPGVVFKLPELVNGLLENLELEQARQLMQSEIEARRKELMEHGSAAERKRAIKALLEKMSLEELQALADKAA